MHEAATACGVAVLGIQVWDQRRRQGLLGPRRLCAARHEDRCGTSARTPIRALPARGRPVGRDAAHVRGEAAAERRPPRGD
eukprot:scaffold23435_cov63-Phaeocystis_antarctica.AAC.3